MTGPAGGANVSGTHAAVDELARLLLAEASRQSVLERVVDLVKGILPAGSEASITVVRKEQSTTTACTGELALRLDEAQYQLGHGPCLDAALSGQFLEISDGRTEQRWPDYLPTFLRHGAMSALAVPVPAVQVAACLNVYATVPSAFNDQYRQAASEFATYAGVALANVDTVQDAREQAEHMRTAMASRAAIEQAKGILMERYKVLPDEAFRLLAEASMRTNRTVRSLAEKLVLTGEFKA